jgi:DNA-binding transcriptional MerR regulator
LYNIKAVVQTTGISPSTLRAWERRYNIARPQRSESGYRLYSERDIAVIRWLKTQLDAGMSISQAVAWLGNITASTGKQEEIVLPLANNNPPPHEPLEVMLNNANREGMRGDERLQNAAS